jgi:hypothetical protein
MGNFFGSSDKNSTINLSQDVLSHVMSFLTEKEIVQVSLTSKQFNSCSNEQTIWKQKLKTLLSTKYSPPKDLNWKQEYINKRFLLNSKSKVNPEFYNEISRQVHKHNGRIIPGEDHKNFIEGHVFPIRFLKFKYYSVEIAGFGDEEVHLYFIEFQNKLYRLVDNFVGILFKGEENWDKLERNSNYNQIVDFKEYGEILESIDFKPIIQKEIFELLSKSFSSVDSLRELMKFLFFLKLHPTYRSYDNYQFSFSKNVDEIFKIYKENFDEFNKHESFSDELLKMKNGEIYSIDFGIYYCLMIDSEQQCAKIYLSKIKFEISDKDFHLEENISESKYFFL